jgi:hypothetical protein
MQSSPAPLTRCLRGPRTAVLAAASILASLSAPCVLGAQVEVEDVERLPPFIASPPTRPVIFEAAVYFERADQCASVVTTGSWRVDLVCSAGVPLWRVRGPFRGGEIRSQVALPRRGWTRLVVRSDGVHTAELYVDGDDARNLGSTFSTWPADWPVSRDFLRRHLDEHGTMTASLAGRLGTVRIMTNVRVTPSAATIAFDSAAAAFAIADAAAVLQVHAQQGRALLLQIGIGAALLLTVGAIGLYLLSSAEPTIRRVH